MLAQTVATRSYHAKNMICRFVVYIRKCYMIHNNDDYKSIMKGERVSVLQHIIRHTVLCMTFFFLT